MNDLFVQQEKSEENSAAEIYFPRRARIWKRAEMTPDEVLLEIKMIDGPRFSHDPGQFVQITAFGIGEVPISICSPPDPHSPFGLCIRSAGKVTGALFDMKEGAWVGIRGPYGCGFPVERMLGKNLVMVAGGLGIAPLRSLILYTLENRELFNDLHLVYGTKSPDTLLFRKDLDAWEKREDLDLQVIVEEADEAWEGPVGVATAPLEKMEISPVNTFAAVTGPPILYRFVVEELFNRGIDPERILLCLERHFQCGVGKCGHCMIDDLYVCTDGPVFPYSTLLSRMEASEADVRPQSQNSKPKKGPQK